MCRNASGGSGLSETGSLDRGKAALERRKKAAEEGAGGGGRVEASRINPVYLIDQLIQATNLETSDSESKKHDFKLYTDLRTLHIKPLWHYNKGCLIIVPL